MDSYVRKRPSNLENMAGTNKSIFAPPCEWGGLFNSRKWEQRSIGLLIFPTFEFFFRLTIMWFLFSEFVIALILPKKNYNEKGDFA